MILHITETEALAFSQALRSKTGPIGDNIVKDPFLGGSIEVGSAAVNIEALESGKAKLKAAMEKSDAKLDRSLDYVISSLEGSGFDIDQLEALRGAKEKAALHNDEKYGAKEVDPKFRQKG
tara:strand:- start:36 stop:398 length:363 start_codon:yes stop_codon:yes gene_type:complete